MTRLSRKAMQLRLENLIYKIGGTNILTNSVEDAFDNLEVCIVCIKHDLESTKRELQAAIGKK